MTLAGAIFLYSVEISSSHPSCPYDLSYSTHLLFLLGNSGELGLEEPSDLRSKKGPGLSNTFCILSATSLLERKE